MLDSRAWPPPGWGGQAAGRYGVQVMSQRQDLAASVTSSLSLSLSVGVEGEKGLSTFVPSFLSGSLHHALVMGWSRDLARYYRRNGSGQRM